MDIQKLLKAEEDEFSDFLFYDIEIFAEDALIVFKDVNGDTMRIYHNTFEGLSDFITDKVLVGYNNYHYDDLILTNMIRISDKNPEKIKILKYINDQIIGDEDYYCTTDDNIFSLDVFQQINVAHSSLKKIEANIGLSIDESSVPFDIDRKLTEDEYIETVKYCEQDVMATIAAFKLRWKSYFIPKIMIIDMLPDEIKYRAFKWNTTTITASILTGNKPVKRWIEWRVSDKSNKDIEQLDIVPKEVWDMWKDPEMEVKKCTVYELGCKIEFSYGGLHGINENGAKEFNNVFLLDVTSLYPNIVLKLDVLGDATSKYREIVNQRMSIKHSDPILSNALKLIINSTYGLMKNEYSKLYNPFGAMSVCFYGQIALYDLCCRLYSAGYTLININTDGVAFTGASEDYEVIKSEWEEDYGFQLELSEFRKWYQKDVNNYVAMDYNAKIKVKGGDLNKYYDPLDYVSDPLNTFAGVTWTGTNTNGIISQCLVNKIVYDIDIIDTVLNNLDNPILFQYILQCGRTYIGTVDEEGNLYQKVNRVFATKDGVLLKKKKAEGNPQYFPTAPESMYVYNGDLRDFDNFKDIVDVNYYVELAEEKYHKLWN